MTYCERCGAQLDNNSGSSRKLVIPLCVNCINRDEKPKQSNKVRTNNIGFWNNRKKKAH